MSEQPNLYSKSNPFYASITERYNLCKPGSLKLTHHIVLNLKNSGITYKVGDSIAIMPFNDPEIVSKTLKALKATGDEIVLDKQQQTPCQLLVYLTNKCNLVEVPRKLIAELIQRQTNPAKKERLELLLADGMKDMLKEYQASHEIWDALDENQEAVFTPQEFCLLLMPLLPRFYSIASSMAEVGEEVHLTVAELVYESNSHTRRGVCTHYLCNMAPMHEPLVPIYIQPTHGFTVPENPLAPMIMIGPGTGVAPYRAFLQERVAAKASGENWLFFGEQHQALNFFYEDYWAQLVQQGKLRLDTAFSRDQEHKVYVQHRMLKMGAELYAWLERGAYFYVCGDAHRMAKDVDAALLQLIQEHGPHDEKAAKDYVKQLKASKRYLRDVY